MERDGISIAHFSIYCYNKFMDIGHYRKYESLFGSWHITEKIGEGAFAKVYVIERKELGVTYQSALKVITIPQDKSEIKSIMSDGMSEREATEYYRGFVQSIVGEFIFMSKLKGNSHVVSYEDHQIIEHEDDIGWDILIRMELLTPLVDYTAEKSMDEATVIKLGIDLCKALEFCRKYNIIHRDIKPENIFIAPSGDYKLGDFGIAKTVEKTRVGLSRKGTYAYMAPEIYKGEAYGATVDIYSLGIVMYKLLNNNRTPFMPDYPNAITYEDREIALAKRIRGETVPEPCNGSEELKNIVMKACSYNAEDRFETAEEMRKALECLLRETERSEDHLADFDGISKKANEKRKAKRKSFKAKANIAAAIAVICGISLVAYAFMQGEITNIGGIEEETDIYIGETHTPEYYIEPERFSDEKIKFDVSDKEIISVNAKGAITGKNIGTGSLTLSAGEYIRKVTINVLPKVTDIYNIEDEVRIEVGENFIIEPKLSPEKFADEKVSYIIEDETIAQIDGDGKITAKSEGTTELVIKSGGYEEVIIIETYIEEEPQQSMANYYNTTPQYEGPARNNNSTENKKKETPAVTQPSTKAEDPDGYFDESDDEYF